MKVFGVIFSSVTLIDAVILLFVYAANRWKYDGNDDYLEGE